MPEPNSTPVGVEHLPPQIKLRCVGCGSAWGEADTGGYYSHEADDVPGAIAEADFHEFDGALYCDDCSFERDRETGEPLR